MDRLFLDDVFVQVVIPQEPQVADLTLNVRMIVWEELGIFDPAEDYVDVAGTFNNWGETPLVLTALNDDDLTYTITIPELEVGETFFFKFRINGSWDDDTAEFPFGGPPREVVLQDSNNTYSYWYNDDLPIVLYELTLLANPENGGNVEGAGNYQSGEQVLLTAIPFEGDESEPGFNPENTAILIDYTAGFESLPPIINDELTRGASFDGRYVYIVSRKNGNFIYVWDSDNPSSEHFSLDFGGVVEGGTWDISDVQVSGTYIYATNMVMHVGEVSKVYRWNGVNDSNPEVILEFTLPDHNIRLGDALSIVGTPPENGKIIMSNFAWPSNASEFFVWNFDQGNITNEIWPIDPENALRLGQYGRINAIDGEPDLYVLSGAEMGIGLINSSGELIFDTSEDIIQFRSYDPNIFEYNGARYLSYTVNREWENQGVFFEVVDISEGTDNLDALQNLTAGNINDKKVHVHSFGPANPVMWVGACNSVRFSNHGNPRILAFSLLSGFLVTEFSADPVEPGYEFINWTDPENNIVNTEAQFTYTMPDYDITLTANFEPIIVEPEVFTLSITVSPENSGTTTGAGEYLAGEQVNITAIANEGYEFVEWTNQDGNIISTMDEYSFAMPEENLEIFANFIEPEPEYFNLILLVNPEDSGVITGEGEYEAGEMVNVTATANEGYIFINWTDIEGFEVNANSSFDFQMPQENKTLVANFDLENIFDEIMPLGLKIYPNPTSDIVKISSDQQIQKIFVMDIFGKVVYSNQTVYDFYLDFNTGQLATGSYFIQIHFENFIIKRALQVLR
ncbi:MAG: DUF4623 domain-containing protein [Bacteroidetes bacterium]|nr:MAG: DUF4623 domain-containing protein [Bacteroidota bacterium]